MFQSVNAVFGFVAHCGERPDSDFDLLVVGDVGLLDLAPTMADIEKAVGRWVDLLLYEPEERAKVRQQSVMRTIREREKIVVLGSTDAL